MNRRISALALVSVVLLSGTAAPGLGQSPPLSSSPSATTAFDQAFIDMMVPHHQSAIAMAVVALARAEHPEIATLAPQIIEAQEREIAQLRGWREAWYGDASTPPLTAMPLVPGMGMSGMDHGPMSMDMSGDIRDLWLVEEDFDKAFIDAMIPHHESAIEAATIALDKAEHQEIRDVARAIIEEQQREIEEMMAWREEWYPEG